MSISEKYFRQFIKEVFSSYIPKMEYKKNLRYPSSEERCKDCGKIRTPSRAYPFSLSDHCTSQKHIKNKLDELGVSSFEDLPVLISNTGILGSLARKFLATYTGAGPT